ncbi:OstA-like protein [Paenimyroides aquimaris]|uniref:OstA-like protein n=1 Tax=Paenimyroides marinum TaxID=1159016 RepID=A0A1H6MBQ4_9FLAO|nr:OstA-like protein [Paenimyroides aquimaris]SEH95520.1 OstA-like protein [Paenimyroides aquimaris]
MKTIFLQLIFLLFCSGFVSAQTPESNGKIIKLLHSNFTDVNEYEVPGAKIATGNVQIQHDSMYIYCNKAYLFEKDNYVKLFGNVKIIQDDTLQMTSKYAEYNGVDKIAYASGNVVMTSPDSSLKSEKVYYDRNTGIAYYNDHATITNKENTLKSKSGKYYSRELKYEFRTEVVITNPETIIKSNHLDYYEDSGHAYLFGPSTIDNKENHIYTENGFYDTRLNEGKMIQNSFILYDNKRIEADEMYYDEKISYAKGINNVKITDTINNTIATSHFAEVFRANDSVYMTKKPLIEYYTEKDTSYFHAKNIQIVGPDKQRIIKGYPDARMYRTPDMSGKSDSLHYDQKIGLLQLIGKPVVFNGESQLTGDLIHLINNVTTEKLDSLKVLNNAFVIQKDTLGTGYNQAKGINMYGKFIDDEIRQIDLVQNAEMIYYLYDDGVLQGIDKGICSKIVLELEEKKITTATRMINPEGTTYPPEEFPENARKLAGFNWRGDERIYTVDELFTDEELKHDNTAEEEVKENKKINEQPMEIQEKTLNFKRKGKAPNVIKNRDE